MQSPDIDPTRDTVPTVLGKFAQAITDTQTVFIERCGEVDEALRLSLDASLRTSATILAALVLQTVVVTLALITANLRWGFCEHWIDYLIVFVWPVGLTAYFGRAYLTLNNVLVGSD